MKHVSNEFFTDDFFRFVETLKLNGKSFELYPHQAYVVDSLFQNKKLVTISERQRGMTTLMILLALWKALRFPKRKILFATHSLVMCNLCLKILKEVSNFSNRNHIWEKVAVFPNGSEIEFASYVDRKYSCGRSFDMVFIDNAAFNKDITDGFLTKIGADSDLPVFINSNPSGKEDWFHKFCLDDNGFTKLFV